MALRSFLIVLLIALPVIPQSKQANSDANLAAIRSQDRLARNAKGELTRLTAEEHLRRASVYHGNRAFEEARAHWQALMDFYPSEPRVLRRCWATGRSTRVVVIRI